MKITPHNTPINDKNSPKEALNTRLGNGDNAPNAIKAKPLKHQDSVKIDESELSKTTKDINNTIGALQIAIKSINEITQRTEELLKNSKEIHTKDSKKSEEALADSKDLKEEIDKIFNTSTFNGENVFEKKYTQVEPKIKFQANSINPDKIEIKNTKNITDFIKDLNLQKKYAKEGIETLSNKVGGVAVNPNGKVDEKYETLQKSALNKEEFKNSHNTEGITLERLTKLLS